MEKKEEKTKKFGILFNESHLVSIKNENKTFHMDDSKCTIGDVFKLSCEKYPNNNCFGYRPVLKKEFLFEPKVKKDIEKLTLGNYEWISYSKAYELILSFARGLNELCKLSNKRLAIFMNTCMEWQISAHACYFSNITVVTLYHTLGEDSVAYGINLTEISCLITESSLMPTIEKILPQCCNLKIIIYTGNPIPNPEKYGEVQLLPFDLLYEKGSKSECNLDTATKDDIAVIMFTSGSTGQPKGVPLTHYQICSAIFGSVESVDDSIEVYVPSDRYIAYLPLSHIFELVCESILLSGGASIGFSSPLTLSNFSLKIKPGTIGDAVALKPTIFVLVPAIVDRIKKGIYERISNSNWIVRYLFRRAVEAKTFAIQSEKDTPFWNFLVFNKIKAMLGGKIKLIISGGAPLSEENHMFMCISFGSKVIQGYGLTETCGPSVVTFPSDTSFGRVGVPISGMEVKLIDWKEGGYLISDKNNPKIGMPRGEVCLAGYYKDEEKTAESFIQGDDGKLWFHSGDIAQIHSDGCLQIIDRKKDLVKLQMGEYVSLGSIESIVKGSKYVDQVCAYANPYERYTVLIIMPVKDQIENCAHRLKIDITDIKKLYSDKKILEEVFSSVLHETKNSKLASFELPKKIYLTTDEWTSENNYLTTALKIKRNIINARYQNEINEMYREPTQ